MNAPKTSDSKFDNTLAKVKAFTSGGIKLSIIIFFSVLAWRIAWSQFSLDLSKFDFSDLLAMILALFAIAMSVAFYFKSTDSSNQFYDNIYNFTQKTSEILGRIEERFGERLRHLDEGYGRIELKFEHMAKSPDEIQEKVKETEGKEEEEKRKLEEANRQMQEMMEDLAQRAKLQEQEKQKFYKQMHKLVAEKDLAQSKIRDIEEDRDRLREQLMMMESEVMEDPELHNPIILKLLHHPEMMHLIRKGVPSRIIRKRARNVISDFPTEYLDQLREAGIVNERGELTTAGVLMLRSIARRFL